MSRTETQIQLNLHNARQRQYFERTVKRTMLPANTRYLRRHVDELLRFADISAGDRVLEVGCGMGRYTLLLAERGIRVEGLDLSPVLLERLQEFDGGRFSIPVHAADILDHPRLLDAEFDAVVGFFTLHHLHDLALSFAAMKRLVKPGGRVAFVEPNPYNLLYYVQIAITPGMTWQGDKGMLQMRRRKIFEAMQHAGLTRFSMRRFGFFPPALTNNTLTSPLERGLELFPLWRPLLPFQLFAGER